MSNLRCIFRYEANGELIPFVPAAGYAIDWPDGADALEIGISPVRNADGIGSRAQSITVPARPITISGYIMDSDTDRQIRRLQRAFAPQTEGRLWADTFDGKRFYLDCRVTSLPAIEGRKRKPRFQVSLIAEYPYWQSEEIAKNTFSINAKTAAMQIDIDSDAPAVWTLKASGKSGTSSGLTITDRKSGEYIQFNASLDNGQVLLLSFTADGRVSCTRSGAPMIRYAVCTMKKLQPGSRTFDISFSGHNGARHEFEFSWREARIGV